MKIYIVVTDVVNDVTYSRKSVNTCVVIWFLWHDVIHWKTATSYDKPSSLTLREDCNSGTRNLTLPSIKFYIEKLGYAGVYLFFSFLLQNIDCGYSLEPQWVPTINVLNKYIKNIVFFPQWIFYFYILKKISVYLHGKVFAMDDHCFTSQSTISQSCWTQLDDGRVRFKALRL